MSRHKNPFVGLRPFEAEDSLYYFGRGEQTGELLTYLHRTRFVAVVGSSGCGKSSLVRAGLIPNLEAGFLVQDRDTWHIARMKPGDRPFYNLAHALLRAVGDGGSAADVTALAEAAAARGIHALVERFAPVLEAEDSNLFLLVDQFEEVFRFGLSSRDSVKREEASEFVDLLLRLAAQVEVPVYVCLTMRSDYIGDCDAFHGLPEAMNRSQYLVPRLTRPQRRQVIEGPIRLAGASIAPQLVDRLLNESGEYRDDLPVLQHALMRTWDQWQKQGDGADGSIDTVHYEAIKTMKQALSRHADEALEELSAAERPAAKALFQLLTETDAENRRIRRSAHFNDIAAVTGASPETLMGIIDKFRQGGRAFLVLASERPDDNPLLDISHESLMRQWGTLGQWMDEEAESADIYRRLADAAQLHKRGKGGLYTDPALQLALVWRENETPTAAWGSRYQKGFDEVMEFLEKSRFVDEKIRKEKRVRDEQGRLWQKSLRFTRLITVVITISFLIAAYLAYFAIKRRQETKRQTLEVNYYIARIFDEMAMTALESGQKTNDPGSYKDAWLYMTAALWQEIDSRKLHLRPASVGELLTPRVANAAFREQWFSPTAKFHSSTVTAVTFSPEGKTIAVSSWDHTILLWDQEFIEEIDALEGHSREVSSVAFSPDGTTIASGSWDKTIRLWNRHSKKKDRFIERAFRLGDQCRFQSRRKDHRIRLKGYYCQVVGQEVQTRGRRIEQAF
jgi:energy-coupling factor transporter ATP-binding protein EcfA2